MKVINFKKVTSTTIFIDAGIENYKNLLSGLPSNIEVIFLEKEQDGIHQITETLTQRAGIQTLYLVCHGSPGSLHLGNTQLNLHTLDQYAPQLQQWASALTQNAEIILCACNVATGTQGTSLIGRLQQLTQAHIAASSTPVGNVAKGGNWILDVFTGTQAPQLLFHPDAMAAYAGILAATDDSVTTNTNTPVTINVLANDIGSLDLIAGNDLLQPQNVFLNNGTGTFTPHPTTPNFGGGYTLSLATGDLDGDGDIDLVTSNGGNANPLAREVFLNDGNGNFTLGSSFGPLGNSRGITLGDLDGDGDLDAVVANRNTIVALPSAEEVFLNDGTGTFTLIDTFGANDSWGVTLGDLDADGDLDAVVANNGPQDVALNDGTGNFSPHPTTPTFGAGNSQAVALGDVDGDQDLDAVVANRFGVAQDVYLNDGSGNFSPGSTFGNGETYGVALGDIDNDGDLDAVVANRTNVPTLPANQQVFLNNGSGIFTLHPTTPTFSTNDSRSVVLGDVDNDGDLDAAIGNFSNQPEAVYLNDGAGNFGAGTTFGGGFTGVVALADVDGINPNSLTVTTAPNAGTAQVNPQTGEIIYTPNAGFTGIDTFVYQADSGTATVSVTVGNAVLPTIAFSQTSYSVQEDGTAISAITLTRSGDPTTASSVNILPSNGTATGGATLGVGVDFQNTAIPVNFAAGATTATITVPVNNDTAVEGNETLTLTLANPTNATLGTVASATLTIVDNETIPAPTPTPEPAPTPTGGTPTPTPEPAPTPTGGTPTPTPEPIPTPTGGTPTPTPEPAPTPTGGIPTPTPEPAPTPTGGIPTPSPTPEPIPTGGIPTPSPTPEPIPTGETPTPTPVPTDGTPTPEPTPTGETPTPTPVPTGETPTPSPTPLFIPASTPNTSQNSQDAECNCPEMPIFPLMEIHRPTAPTNPLTTTQTGTDQNETLIGSMSHEALNGEAGNDMLWGKGGSDRFTGGSGNDVMVGDAGSDHSGHESDWMDAGIGDDIVFGNQAADVILAGAGDDSVWGGQGDDWIDGDQGSDIIFGNLGNDLIIGETASEQSGDLQKPDQLFGNQENDSIWGSDGNDSICAGQGNDLASGGEGNDRIFGDLGNDTLAGNNGNDTLIGGNGTHDSSTLDGADLLDAGAGDDWLCGNEGDDSLTGNVGNDTVHGGQGNDLIEGNAGRDLLYGDVGNDSICAGEGNDSLMGGTHTPATLDSQTEQDYLCGGAGNDLIYGNQGADTLNGAEDDDSLFGGQGNDLIYGSAGNDWIWGDFGNDTLAGGSGNDCFVLVQGAGSDVILDFIKGQDSFILTGGLSFSQLTITAGDQASLIYAGEELLATVQGIADNKIEINDFRTI